MLLSYFSGCLNGRLFVQRVSGKKELNKRFFIISYGIDIAKVMIPLLLSSYLTEGVSLKWSPYTYVFGIMCLLGHTFSVFFHFQGDFGEIVILVFLALINAKATIIIGLITLFIEYYLKRKFPFAIDIALSCGFCIISYFYVPNANMSIILALGFILDMFIILIIGSIVRKQQRITRPSLDKLDA